ncbi:MAG: ABA4-like family protein [Spirosomaceae bacterium]|jgi:hypothetical protein|nr:ABA4-like family protein [Spirosomataceae bacterium]
MAEKLFKFANTFAFLCWILLIVFPHWQHTNRVIIYATAIGLSSLYVYLIVTNFGKTKGNFTTLRGVTKLFEDPINVLTGWVHYLAFDLMTGLYISTHAFETGFHRMLLIPCLLLTFIFGPAGWLLYVLLQILVYGRWF